MNGWAHAPLISFCASSPKGVISNSCPACSTDSQTLSPYLVRPANERRNPRQILPQNNGVNVRHVGLRTGQIVPLLSKDSAR